MGKGQQCSRGLLYINPMRLLYAEKRERLLLIYVVGNARSLIIG